jgi:CheY-like chemotaxis protein
MDSEPTGFRKMIVTNKNESFRPLLILAYADSAHAANCSRYFRRLGWEVRLVATAAEVWRLLNILAPKAIVLDTELPDESGWLTCAKITHQNRNRRVVLLTPEITREAQHDLASGKAVPLVSRRQPIAVLAEAVIGRMFAEAV